MKINWLLFTLFLVKFSVFAQLQLHQWDDSYYDKYTYRTFKQLSVVQQKIDPDNIDYKLLNAAIFYRTNEERFHNGEKQFIHSSALEKSAFDFSKDMVDYDFYSHDSPIKGRETLSTRVKLVGINYSLCAENIYDYNSRNPTYWSIAEQLVAGWMRSPGHRRNLLNINLNYLGCGAVHYINKDIPSYFWVKSTQDFSDQDAK